MKKKKLRKDVGEVKEFNAESYGGTHTDINEVIEFFSKAKEAGATHVDWYAISDSMGYSEYCHAQPFYEREETDDEFNKRQKVELENEKRQADENVKREKVQYERLKAKFDKPL